MKTKPVYYFLIVAILLAGMLIIASCFSPWAGDSGNLTLVWGNADGRWVTDPDDLDKLDYIVTLRGPGGTIEKHFEAGIGSANIDVIPGTWNVTIKGHVFQDIQGKTVDVLLVMGIEQIEVKAGQKKSETINMYNAREINEWSEIDGYLWVDFVNSESIPGTSPTEYRSVMLLINKDLVADATSVSLPDDVPVIIVAERDVTIRRGLDFDNPFFDIYDQNPGDITLTLGKNGMAGTLTFDGKLKLSPGNTSDDPVGVSIRGYKVNGCTLNMYNGVTIKGNKQDMGGCGVEMVNIGDHPVFNMYGGTITGNDIGVDYSDGGTFNKYGGTVSGNGVNEKK